MTKKLYDFDLIVIGSGIAGSIAAQLANDEGKKTAIVEEDVFGGECPNWGCIPTKTLLQVAHTYDQAKRGDAFGLRTSTISYNYPSIRAWKDRVLRLTGMREGNVTYEKSGIKVIKGHAGFISRNEIVAGNRHYSARNFLLATGSRLVWPEIDGLDRVKYLTHHEAINLPRAPRSIAIVGGGTTAVEFAELFAIFGSKVYLFEKQAHLLPEEDPEVGELLTTIFERDRSMNVITGSAVTKVRQSGAKKEVFYGKLGDQSTKVDEILIATGKAPNVNIGLENAGVKYSADGIKVNRHQQTSQSHIFAAGDCTGLPHFTHLASMQSRVALHNMFHRKTIETPAGAVPRVTYTWPEIASIGLTAEQARVRGLKVRSAIATAQVIPRSQIDNQNEGFAKLLVESKTSRLLGASLVCPSASELIHELSIVMHAGLSVTDLQIIYHAFPTWSELIQVAANQL